MQALICIHLSFLLTSIAAEHAAFEMLTLSCGKAADFSMRHAFPGCMVCTLTCRRDQQKA